MVDAATAGIRSVAGMVADADSPRASIADRTVENPADHALPGRSVKRETGATGLEPATSGVTGRRSNQLNYAPWAGRV